MQMIRSIALFVLVSWMAWCSSCTVSRQDKHYQSTMRVYQDSMRQAMIDNEYLQLSKAETEKVSYFKPDRKYIITCDVTSVEDGGVIEMPTVAGKVKQLRPYAYVTFELNQKRHKLTAYQYLINGKTYEGSLFLPVVDLTTGETSYGGGRYLEVLPSEINDDTVVLDFNKLYNPWCAYRDGFNCIVPPRENYLDVALPVGEKNYDREH